MEIVNYPKYRLLDGNVVSNRNFPLICDDKKRVWVENIDGHVAFIRVKTLVGLAVVPKKPKRKYTKKENKI